MSSRPTPIATMTLIYQDPMATEPPSPASTAFENRGHIRLSKLHRDAEHADSPAADSPTSTLRVSDPSHTSAEARDVEKGDSKPAAGPTAGPGGPGGPGGASGPGGPGGPGGPPPVPDGGLAAWLVILGCWLTMMNTFGMSNAIGVFQAYYQFTLLPNKTASDISWIGSLQLFLLLALGSVSGPLFDKGYFYHLFATGAILYIVCWFMISLCTQYWQIMLAQGLGIGIANGLLFTPSLGIVGHWFFKKRVIAMGVLVTGSSFGGVIFPIMLNRLFVSHGFRRAVQYTGYLLLGNFVIAAACLRTRLKPKKKPPISPKAMFSDRLYSLTIAGMFFAGWGLFFPFFYIQVFAQDHGIRASLTDYTLAILNAASIIGRVVPNFYAQRVGSLNLFCVFTVTSSILVWSVFGAGSEGGLIIVSLLYGLFSGGWVGMMGPSLIAFAQSPLEFGARMGLGMLVFSFGVLTGTPITGALLRRYGYYAPITWSGVTLLVGAASLGIAGQGLRRRKGTWKV